MLNRAYALLEIKAIDEDARVITGMATTPEPDRLGDIVEPKGAKFKLPIPLLWQHDSQQPIGEVFAAKVTAKGIEVKARIAKVAAPGKLQDRLNEVWQCMTSDPPLVRGLSVGFRPEETEEIKGSFGIRFLKWLWIELSAVTIPANASASIATIKALDAPFAPEDASRSTTAPGVSGSSRVVKTIRQERVMKKSYADQIKALENTRAAKVAELDAILEKSIETGETMDEAQKTQHDDLEAEIKSVDEDLVRFRAAEKRMVESAVEVVKATPIEPTRQAPIQVNSRMPDGLEFCAMVLCKAQAWMEFQKGNIINPLDIAKKRYPDYQRIQQYLVHKTAVAGGTTTDANFAAALLPSAQSLEGEFLAYLRPKTIIGKFGQDGVPPLRRVPFNVKIASQTSGASASWVGEGKAKPVTKFNTTSTTLLFTKVAAISVITEELARFSSPGAESVVRDELVRACVERLDIDFVDPDKAASSGVNPASITNGVAPLSSAGVSAANVLTDVQNLVSAFVVANYDVSQLVLLMPNSLALVLSLMQNSLGQDSFRGMTINGGTLAGLPVITSQYLGNASSYGNMIIAVSANDIALADDGSVSVDASREASIEMSDAPGGDATAGTGASVVSMFQTNSIALRAEREINWKKLRTTAVRFIDDVNWGSIGSPA